jgi:hypothetical protein
MVQSGAELAVTAPVALPAPLALQIYSCLQAYAKTAGFLALMKAYQNTIKQIGAPVLTPAAIFSEQHAEFWREVLRDTEGNRAEEGRLIPLFHDAAMVFKLASEPLAFQLGSDDASGNLQQLLYDVICFVQEPWQMVDLNYAQQLGDMAVVGSLLPICNTSLCSRISSYLSASAESFCCGNPSCINLAGRSEFDLVMGGAAGRGGGYCSSCKRVCYCSEACQRECWEDHSQVCTKYQQEQEKPS